VTDNTSKQRPTRVAILGLGSLGLAILEGLREPESGLAVSLSVTNASDEKAAMWDAVPDVTAYSTASTPDANARAATDADIVVLAVKPWHIGQIASEISSALSPNTIVVSVAAGIPTSALEAVLPESVSVLRAMPNTPALVRRGVTGLCAGSRASEADIAQVQQLFLAVGEVVVVSEQQMDALGALSGSGPAYVFYFIEQLMALAEAKGFSAADARTLVVETFAGAVELLMQSGEQPAELRRRVTSPNGTTEQAIAVFDEAKLRDVFDRALNAAIQRSREIAEDLS
jgi:pyrroline-5-carboxylate reductase